MRIVPKALAAFVFVMAIPTFMLAGLNLVDPESAVMAHGCFWTPTAFDRFFAFPLYEHPLWFALVSGAVLVVALLIATSKTATYFAVTWRAFWVRRQLGTR